MEPVSARAPDRVAVPGIGQGCDALQRSNSNGYKLASRAPDRMAVATQPTPRFPSSLEKVAVHRHPHGSDHGSAPSTKVSFRWSLEINGGGTGQPMVVHHHA